MAEKTKYLLSGAVAGILNGLLGAGGGVLLVPLLLGWIGLPARRAFATSVFIILPISAVTAAVYLHSGSLDLPLAAPYLLGGLMGGLAAGKLFKRLPVLWLRRAFGVVLIIGGVRSVFSGPVPPGQGAAAAVGGFVPAALAGLMTGLMTGAGIGGGTLLVLYLTALAGVPQLEAQGVNLLYFLVSAPPALYGHLRNRLIAVRPALWAAASGSVCALAVALLTRRLDEGLLRRIFGGLFLLVGVREWLAKPPPRDSETP